MGAPLEDARQLAQRYDRLRQEAEAQVKFLSFYHCNFMIEGKGYLAILPSTK